MLVDPGQIDRRFNLTTLAMNARLDLIGRNAETTAIESVEPVGTRELLFYWLEQRQGDQCDLSYQYQCANYA